MIGGVVGTGGLVPGEFVALVVEWDQPYVTGAPNSGGATSQLDLCVNVAASGGDIITDGNLNATTCTGPNELGADPVLMLLVGNPANAAGNTSPETITISLGLVSGSPAPGRIKVAVLDNGAGSTINQFFTPGSTVQGHARSSGAMSMGAAFWATTPACGVTPAQPESFSSAGGDPTLFDAAGNLLPSTPVPAEARPRRPGRRQQHFPWLHDHGHRSHGLPAVREQPQAAELLRDVCGHTARGRRRGPDAAVQPGGHRGAGLRRPAQEVPIR